MILDKLKEGLGLAWNKYEDIGQPDAGLNKEVMRMIRSKGSGKEYVLKRYKDCLWDTDAAGFVEYSAYRLMQHFAKHSSFIKVPRVVKLSFEERPRGRGSNHVIGFQVATDIAPDTENFSDLGMGHDNYGDPGFLESLKSITALYHAILSNHDFHSANIVGRGGKTYTGGYYMIDFERSLVSPMTDDDLEGAYGDFEDGLEEKPRIFTRELMKFLKATKPGDLKKVIRKCYKEATDLIYREEENMTTYAYDKALKSTDELAGDIGDVVRSNVMRIRKHVEGLVKESIGKVKKK